MNRRSLISLAAGALAVAALPLRAAPAADALLSEGEVRRIDAAQGKLTLRHGPLANLDMPAMTMVFTVTDRQLLQGLKAGDKVRFTAVKENGNYLVRAIQRVD